MKNNEKEIYNVLRLEKIRLKLRAEELIQDIVDTQDIVEYQLINQYKQGMYDTIFQQIEFIENLIERKLSHYDK